jgi:hypothetical protein
MEKIRIPNTGGYRPGTEPGARAKVMLKFVGINISIDLEYGPSASL